MIEFKLARGLLGDIRKDLRRPHAFAAERVGFITTRVAKNAEKRWIILAHSYHPVDDADYMRDDTVGAMINASAFRKIMQFAYFNDVGIFHIHMHEHAGTPWFSRLDLRESAQFVPDFFNVKPHMVHGALVTSLDHLAGLCWHPQDRTLSFRIEKFKVIG